MTDQTIVPPPITPPPTEAAVDENTLRQIIADVIDPLKSEVSALKDTVSHRPAERAAELQSINDNIHGIRQYVEGVKEQRDKEIADRPTRIEVAKSLETAADAFAKQVRDIVQPLVTDITYVKGRVDERLSDKDEGIQRHERRLDLLQEQFEQQEQRADERHERRDEQLVTMQGEFKALQGFIFGDPNKPDAEPSLMATLRSLDAKLGRDMTALRSDMDRVTTRLAAVEDKLAAQERERIERAKRWRSLAQHSVVMVREAPKWFQLGVILMGVTAGGTSLTAALLALIEFLRGVS